MRRLILIPTLVVVALFAIAAGVFYWIYNSYTFYSTDDAQVTGQILSVSSPQAGTLSAVDVKLGDTVTAGQAIASISTVAANGEKTTLTITSPIAGTIIQENGIQGQSVTPGLALAQVTDLNNLYVTAYVDENQIANVKQNQDVDVNVDAFSGTTYKGHIKQIVQATAGSFSLLPSSDMTSGNYTKVGQRVPVIISVDGFGGNDIVPGMSTKVTIHLH
ncbi:HlyD family secretion protein [Tengunoibacter tsumagoiensis]|uniref:Multidrug efflux protein n=1 Tax=Tengunoibacter tsumagoiensis TaxID=2014871 RepID=A0A401ZWB9_9CHLR|nr:efflux RND transporter periplasmic adaptor subunit [Tengunoibacter tsumagoiensis]GCE11178.1 multidrug efflux protein [Tengunoibacter tsumagoiensis]